MKVRNPRTGLYDYHFAELSEEDIAAKCSKLLLGQRHWSASGLSYRVNILQQWKSAIQLQIDALEDALSKDTGRVWESKLEINLLVESIDRWCKMAETFFVPIPEKETRIPFIRLQQAWVPVELVGVISPWNFPLLLSLIDTIPALLAGSAVIVKPSEVTPRFIEIMNSTIAAVPDLAKVLSYIAGDGKTGASLIKYCKLICFTGSTATGRKVYAAAAEYMIPVFLELGGKDPAIVLPSANLEQAAASIFWGSTANAGQSCLSIERVYAHASIHDELILHLKKIAENILLNAFDINEGEIGPIIFENQVQIINNHLRDALEKGATLITGSTQCENIGGGYYCRPTILSGVTHQMKIMQEETFGPIIPVMRYNNTVEAVALANDSIYGLSGAVFAGTTDEAMEIGKQICGGAISINDAALTAIMHEGEKTSFKLSGIGGSRMGAVAMRRFLKQKVYIIKNGMELSPWTTQLHRKKKLE
ncbi:MAG: aldehyde dehydrogenase family protein [Chitinophagia bacterium]